MPKSEDAFRTIGELSKELGVAQHILRYWETRFPQLRPMQRAGNRRYYRPDDVALVRRIHGLLGEQGYTIKGVQKILAQGKGETEPAETPPPRAEASGAALPGNILARLESLRDRLRAALAAS